MYLNDKTNYPDDKLLMNVLPKIPAEKQIKVGCEHGTGFFWFGTAGELLKKIDEIDSKIVARASSKICYYSTERLHCTAKGVHRKAEMEQRIISIAEYLSKYTSVGKRGVVSMDTSTVDRRLRIIIQGYEEGGYWDYQEFVGEKFPPLDINKIEDECLHSLMQSVYRMAFDDLKHAYRESASPHSKSCKNIEKLFLHDPYGLISEETGMGIIKECKRQAKENIKRDGRADNGKQKAEKSNVKTATP